MKSFFVGFVVSMLLVAPSWAGITSAKVDSVLIYDGLNGLVYIYPVGGVSNPPTCHGSNGDYYSFAMTRPFAKEYFAMAMAAQVSGATLNIYGTGTCTDQWNSETVSYLSIAD